MTALLPGLRDEAAEVEVTLPIFPANKGTGLAVVSRTVIEDRGALVEPNHQVFGFVGEPRSIAPENRIAAANDAATSEGHPSPTGRTNKRKTLEDVSKAVGALESTLCRDRFPISQVRVVGDRVIAGHKEYQLDNVGLQNLCKSARAPVDYLVSLNRDLRSRVLQSHFDDKRFADPKLTDGTSCIVSRNGAFRGLSRVDLLTLNNADVLLAAREGVGSDALSLEVQNFHLSDEVFVLEMVSSRIAEEVRPGDVLHGGVQVRHSHGDGQATTVFAYVNRLVCGNGLVQRQCVGETRRSTPRTRRLAADRPDAKEMQMAQVRSLVANNWKDLQAKLASIRRLKDKPIEIKAILERFLRQAHLFSRSLMESLLLAWEVEGSEETAFGALNALTRVATHSEELPSWQRTRLARLAGVFANQDVHLCKHCYSVLVR
jgi:hypothetical protein